VGGQLGGGEPVAGPHHAGQRGSGLDSRGTGPLQPAPQPVAGEVERGRGGGTAGGGRPARPLSRPLSPPRLHPVAGGRVSGLLRGRRASLSSSDNNRLQLTEKPSLLHDADMYGLFHTATTSGQNLGPSKEASYLHYIYKRPETRTENGPETQSLHNCKIILVLASLMR